jgi:hypothetical protein
MKPITMIVINWVKPGWEAEYKRLSETVFDAMSQRL